MNTTKYGNDRYWCFVEDGWSGKEVAIWRGPENQEEIIARAANKYDAKTIIDALLQYTAVEDKNKFSKKELAFLEFVASNCVEPYATMASNALMWNDWETYNKLKSEFPVIYS